MKLASIIGVGLLSIGNFSCSSADIATVQEQEEALASASNFTYYTLRPDFRKCVSPLCGGYFVKRVNQRVTRCADGSLQNECYVAALDLLGAGLNPKQAAQITEQPAQFLLRGDVLPRDYPSFGNLGVFAAQEAWEGHADVSPKGTFFRAHDTGLVCIVEPCPSFTSEELNRRRPARTIAKVDLTAVVPDPQDGYAQLRAPEGVLLAGFDIKVSGPAGHALGIAATEYYLPFRSEGRVCGTIQGLPCNKGEYCAFGIGRCSISDDAGVCQTRSDACPAVYDPVCGCDGKTYGNSCYAASAGMSIDHDGECQ